MVDTTLGIRDPPRPTLCNLIPSVSAAIGWVGGKIDQGPKSTLSTLLYASRLSLVLLAGSYNRWGVPLDRTPVPGGVPLSLGCLRPNKLDCGLHGGRRDYIAYLRLFPKQTTLSFRTLHYLLCTTMDPGGDHCGPGRTSSPGAVHPSPIIKQIKHRMQNSDKFYCYLSNVVHFVVV